MQNWLTILNAANDKKKLLYFPKNGNDQNSRDFPKKESTVGKDPILRNEDELPQSEIVILINEIKVNKKFPK